VKKRLLWALGIFVLSLVVYTLTLCPTIYWEDSAAFVTAANTLGIPHSPGFPIYVLLGRISSLFQINNPAWPVNFMSAFWGSLSLGLLFVLFFKVLRPNSEKLSFITPLVATSFVLHFAFTTTFWSQAFRAEVYTLSLFFTVLLILLLLKWSDLKEHDPGTAWRFFILFAFIWGVSATNHSLLVISLAPAFLLFILLTDSKYLFKLSNLIPAIFFGLVGLTPYLYLLIRSRQNPALNWGRPDNWENLWRVITKSDSWHGSLNVSNVNLWANLIQMANFMLSELLLPVVILAALGAVIGFKKRRRIFALLAGIFIGNLLVVAWAAEFSTRNLDLLGYLIPSLMVLVAWAAVGAFRALQSLQEQFKPFHWKTYTPMAASILLILPIYQLSRNFKSSDRSQNYFAYQYAKQILDSVRSGSVVIVADDNTLTPLWYMTLVESYRPDVTPLSWSVLDNLDYLRSVKIRRPELIVPVGLNKPEWIEKFAKLNHKIPLFTQYVDLPSQTERAFVPAGFMLRYSPDKVDLEPDYVAQQFTFLQKLYSDLGATSGLDLNTKEHFGNLFFNWGVYFDRQGLPEQSFLNFDRAIQIDQTNDRYYTALGKGFLRTGKLAEAEKFFSAALELNPYNEDNQRYLSLCRDSSGVQQNYP